MAIYAESGNFRRPSRVQDQWRAYVLSPWVLRHSTTMAQTPNIEAQRTALKKLSFLIGEWSGEASAARGPGIVVELSQTEVAEFKLDGLVLMIEGVGRTKSDGKLALQALGLITFDDSTETYRMCAYNDGRWLETEVKLLDDGKSLSWGFALGEISTKSVLRINEKGEWTKARGGATRTFN